MKHLKWKVSASNDFKCVAIVALIFMALVCVEFDWPLVLHRQQPKKIYFLFLCQRLSFLSLHFPLSVL